ncbi:MAG: thiamine phosphate synthase, partial [Sedimenticolaceae bacterium]
MTHDLWGLYVITDDRRSGPEPLSAQVAAALTGGARVVQYRDKSTDQERRLAEARVLGDLCRQRQIPLLINDDVDLAVAVNANGVHLGRDDAGIASARERLPAGSLVGVSCYDDFELAREAARGGADYIAFGSFFPSPTKPDAVPAQPDLLRRARRELALPTVA